MPAKKTLTRQAVKPVVLIVDDDEREANAARLLLRGVVEPIARIPADVKSRDLARAALVLLDFKLSLWPERDKQVTPSLRPQNGLALAAVLKSNLMSNPHRSPTAFALRSGLLQALGGSLAQRNREHAIAKMLDVEWVFAKGMDSERFARQVSSLAVAVKALPRSWATSSRNRPALTRLLKPPKAAWKASALEQVDAAHPPEDVLAETTQGLAALRWILHEVLPYPSFLLDVRYLAARLFVEPAEFRAALEGSKGDRILAALRPVEYRGALDDFLGPRWWRAGVEAWLWSITRGNPFSKSALQQALLARFSHKLPQSSYEKPVVTVDADFRPTDTLIELANAVQVTADDWPPAAAPAWVSLADALANPDIAARVSPRDRERLEKNEVRK